MADSKATPVRIFSVCSGTAMLDQGLKAALRLHGMPSRVVGYNERQAFPATMLMDRMEAQALEPAPIFAGDLAGIDWSRWIGGIDWFVGGIPCQPFSQAGKQLGTDDDRWLWPTLWDAVRRVGAWGVVIENVAAFTIRGLTPLLSDLAEAGWIAEWGCLRASDVGAPHQRNRIFLVAVNPMANPDRPRPQGGNRPEQAGQDGGDAGRGSGMAVSDGRSFFPPGPGDTRAWSEVEASIKPAVCRVANGLAYGLDKSRTDRLRACGNGVVALQAGYAIAELLERLAAP